MTDAGLERLTEDLFRDMEAIDPYHVDVESNQLPESGGWVHFMTLSEALDFMEETMLPFQQYWPGGDIVTSDHSETNTIWAEYIVDGQLICKVSAMRTALICNYVPVDHLSLQ